MSGADAYLELALGLPAHEGDARRLHGHWQADRALIATAVAAFEADTATTFFDQPQAAFDALVRR